MKVLYLLNYAGKGGTEKYVRDLVGEYHGKKAECFFAYNEEGLLLEQLRTLGVKCFHIPMKSVFDIGAARSVAKLCKEHGIDVVHTQFPRENYIAVLAKLFNKKIKVFNTSHLIMHQGGVWKILNKILSPYNERVFAVCNCGKDTLVSNGVKAERIEVVLNGIRFPENTEKTLRKELSIPEETFVISALTRYSAEKGLHFLVDTINEMKKRNVSGFKFVIAGDGVMYDEITGKIDALGLRDAVHQIGYRNDTANVLASSDMFVNLSSTEALSFAIIEALSHGLPVVATDVGGTGDIINRETACGTLVEYGNVSACADAIIKLMDDKQNYSLCSENAIKAVKDRFDIQKVFDTVFSRYEESLK